MKPYYEADGITIYHGDCREILPHVQADVIVTDPPYGIAWSIGAGTSRGGGQPHAGIQGDEDVSVRDAALALLAGKPGIVFGSFYAPPPADVKQVLVWAKPEGSGVVGSVTGWRRDAEPVFLIGPWPQRSHRWSSILRPGIANSKRLALTADHPHRKPVGLLLDLIAAAPAGVIVDPFVGSGATLRAAKDLGRRAVGIELDERYCEMAAKRLGQMVLDVGTAA